MSKGSPAIVVRLSASQISRIKITAREQGLSVSDLVREALRLYFLQKEKDA